MSITLRMLEDHLEHKKGSLVTPKPEDVDAIIAQGIAEKYVPEFTMEQAEGIAEKAVADIVDKATKDFKLPKVEMGEDENDKTVFKAGGEFYDSVARHAKGETTEKMGAYISKAPSGQNTIIDSEGGFLVPGESSNQLIKTMDATAMIAPRCTPMPINNYIELPYIRDFDKSSSWAGGVAVAWGAEGGTLSDSTAEFGRVQLKLNKLHALVYATDELLSDSSIGMEQVINMLAGVALAKEVDYQIVNGTGAGRPKGILNALAVESVAKTSGQAAATFTFQNALDMWEKVSDRNNAVWLMNRQVLAEYYKMSQIVGTGGNTVIVTNGRERLPETLFGAPIIETEHCQVLGTVGDVILTDLSQYLYATKAGGPDVKSASSIHVKFTTDQMAFRFTKRVDGKGWWKSAQTQKDGTNTVTPFVTLAARA